MDYEIDYGFDILATGEARIIREETPDAKIAFGKIDGSIKKSNGKTKIYWSEIFENNPNILQPGEDSEKLIIANNYPTHRPFINYAKSKYAQTDGQQKILYKAAFDPDYEATRGELFFSDSETAEAEKLIRDLNFPIVFVGPSTNVANKSWLPERWEELIKQSSYNFVQLIYDGQATNQAAPQISGLKGVRQIDTKTFRQACAVLKACIGRSLLLTVEGDLHHAAAALNMPAIVLWSHYSHPDNLGYEEHINIRWDAAGKPCGLRDSCIQCKHSMEMIKVEDALLALNQVAKEIR